MFDELINLLKSYMAHLGLLFLQHSFIQLLRLAVIMCDILLIPSFDPHHTCYQFLDLDRFHHTVRNYIIPSNFYIWEWNSESFQNIFGLLVKYQLSVCFTRWHWASLTLFNKTFCPFILYNLQLKDTCYTSQISIRFFVQAYYVLKDCDKNTQYRRKLQWQFAMVIYNYIEDYYGNEI